jgi:cell division protein FtsB
VDTSIIDTEKLKSQIAQAEKEREALRKMQQRLRTRIHRLKKILHDINQIPLPLEIDK